MGNTICIGTNCPVKEKCYRFNENPHKYQSMFVNVPSKIINNTFTCDMYWGNNAEQVWNQLKNITKINKKEK